MKHRLLGSIVLIEALVITLAPLAADANDPRLVPEVGSAVRWDTSPPFRDIATPVAPPAAGPAREIPNRIVEGMPEKFSNPTGPDPIRQTEFRPIAGAEATPTPIVNVDAIANLNGVLPPDTEGDVGKDYYVQWVNLSLAVYNKSDGSLSFGPVNGNSLWSGFGGQCETTNNGDPIVLYDHLAEQWFLSQFRVSTGTQCVAVSTTSDPTGPYHRYEFLMSPGEQNDYPHIGLWEDGYYFTSRDFPVGATFAGAGAMERAPMLVGDAAQIVKFGLQCTATDCVDGFQPPHLEGPAPPAGTLAVFLKDWDDDFNANGAQPDRYRLWEMSVDWGNLGASTFTELPGVPSSVDFDQDMCGFFVRNCIAQPSTSVGLDAIDELTMYRLQFRDFGTHFSLLINHTVDASGTDVAGPRWAEIRSTDAGSTWALHQDGVYSPDDNNRWMGSIAMDQAGNIALGYSVSSSTVFPSIRYTTRQAGDPLGMMPGGEVTAIAGTGNQTNSFNRWGDYSSMSVDPVDGCTFWYTQEYIETSGNSNWKTRLTSFKFDNCDTGIFADGFESGDMSAWSN